jgi:outer membrane protein TolC
MKKLNTLLLIVTFLLINNSVQSQNQFSLDEVIQRALSQSPDFKIAETRKENRYWQFRYYKTNYIPQLRLLTNTFGSLYTNQFTPVRQPDGSVEYKQLNQLNPGLNFSLQQPIAATGGQIWVNSTYNFFNNYTTDVSQWNGTPVNIFLNQPLFAFNPLKWDRKIEPIRYEESKRDYAESMESIARDAADLFFSVLQQQINLQIAQFNLANNDTIYKIEQGRYNIGTTSEDKLLQIELQLLNSRKDVAQARLDFQTASLQLRTFIGLRNGEEFALIMPDAVPQFTVGEDEALAHATETRSAYVAFQRRKFEAESEVAQAKGQRYQVSLTASYGLNNVGPTLGDLYLDPARQQAANLSVNIPVIDWGRRKALMRTALANKKLTDYIINQDQITFEQEILTKVRQFEMLRLQIEITKKSDEVALARYNVAQNRYLIGKTDILNLSTALREKDEAKRSYVQALKSFWSSYYDLRRLTLYDFIERKYLYNPLVEE